MIPIFEYGEEMASSAAVESSFKKLKYHILSLKGASLIRGVVRHNRLQTNSTDHSFQNICENDIIMDALFTRTPLETNFNPTNISSPISEIGMTGMLNIHSVK